MSGSNNNDNKKLQTPHKKDTIFFSSLDIAQISLGVGALFGLLAVIGLVVLAWQFALVMLSLTIAMAGLMVAVVLLIIPSDSPRRDITPEGESSTAPKQSGVGGTYDFVHSTRQILKSTGEQSVSTSVDPGHFSSPLSSTISNETLKLAEATEENINTLS